VVWRDALPGGDDTLGVVVGFGGAGIDCACHGIQVL
jgi:hypothetical protein